MKSYTSAALLLCSLLSFSQNVGINDDGTDPDASAMLDVKSTTRGMLIPRMTTTQRTAISSPATGLLVFDSDTETFWFRESSAWVELLNGSVSSLEDADGDTKIQAEESADEDIIRFDVEGSERWRMQGMRLEPVNNESSIFIGQNSGLTESGSLRRNIGIGNDIITNNTNGHSNVAIGLSILNDITSAAGNIAMGNYAMTDVESGSFNIGIGLATLLGNTTGSYNVAVGYNALSSSTTTNDNIGIGNSALQLNTGSNNVGLGTYTMGNKTSGDNNVVVGHHAGVVVTSGSENTLVGTEAGRGSSSHSKSGSVFVGYQAGYNEHSSNRLYVENSNSTTPLIYGEFDNDILRVNGTLQVGNPSGTGFAFPSVDGTNGQVMTTDGSGALSWAESTAPTPTLIEDADQDTKIQVEEGSNDDIIRFDVSGTERLTLSTNANDATRLEFVNTDENVLIGDDAGLNLAPSGSFDGHSNVMVGHTSGRSTTTGYFNVFIGQRSGYANTTGYHNVFIGKEAGSGNLDGIQNVFTGIEAGKANTSGQYNSFYGGAAGSLTTTGSSNTFIGRGSGGSNSTGSTNTYLGRESGSSATGSGNVFLGYQAGSNETGSNKLYVENSNTATPLIWGDFSSDMVGINRVATTNTLEVGGDASKASAGDWLANSDERLKRNITPLNSEETLTKLLSLRGITYEWDDKVTGNKRPGGFQYGFTAQNIQQVFPILVKEDNQGYLQTAYGTYDAMTVEAIRALYSRIVELESTISNLQEQLEKQAPAGVMVKRNK